jgi:hypothetical protein
MTLSILAKTKRAWANLVEYAYFAFGFSCNAYLPAVENQQVGYFHPLVFWDNLH